MTGRVLRSPASLKLGLSRADWRAVLSPLRMGAIILSAGLLLFTGVLAVLVYSPSPSLPPGLYLRALPLHALRIGDLVVFTPPAVVKPTLPVDRADAKLLKEVAGLAGTHVCWEADRMVVHAAGEERHYLYAPQAPIRPQMQGCQVLGEGEMLVVGHHGRSVDSRYIGPVQKQRMLFRVWPLWTQETS